MGLCGGLCPCNYVFNQSMDDCSYCEGIDEEWNTGICLDQCGVVDGDDSTCCVDDSACNYGTDDACIHNQVSDGGFCCSAETNYDCENDGLPK